MTCEPAMKWLLDAFPKDRTPEEAEDEDRGTKGYRIRCGVIKYRPPRHEFFELIREMGAAFIPDVLDGKPLRGPELDFVFPERWMSVHEQQAFFDCLNRHPDVKKIKCVNIVTSSPLLVGGMIRQQIRIFTFEDDKLYCGVRREREERQ